MKKLRSNLGSLFSTVLPKMPMFLLAFPFVLLMRILRPIIWIRLIPVYDRFGHAIANTEVYLVERRAGLEQSKTIDFFYPDRPWKCNRQLIKMWKRLIPLYDWLYWIGWANLEIPGGEAHHYTSAHGERDVQGLSNDIPPPVSFTMNEEDRGAVLLREMGIPAGSKIVCFHARDNAFLKGYWPEANWEYLNFRDVNIDHYVSTIKELVARGYYAIRMGRVAEQAFSWKDPHVIDYAMSNWKSDFADMYLISRCRFYIGSASGMDEVARFFRKQRVIVNMIPIKYVCTWSPDYLYIFKKLWMVKEKRFLTFKEIIDSQVGNFMTAIQYKEHGLEIIDNTPEEIFDVIMEKEEKMRGSWTTNEEYEHLQRKFWSLFKSDSLSQVLQARVGSKFLLQNKDLLGEI